LDGAGNLLPGAHAIPNCSSTSSSVHVPRTEPLTVRKTSALSSSTTTTKYFVFFSPPEIFFCSSLSRLVGSPCFPEPRRGSRHWRLAHSSLFSPHLCRERGPGGLGKTTSLENLSVYLFLAKGSVISCYIFLASVFAILESFISWFCMGPCTCRGSDITCLTATPINHPSCVHSP
jgi:hypothetical protein